MRRERLIAVEQIRMLNGHVRAQDSGRGCSGGVDAETESQRTLIAHLGDGVDGSIGVTGPQENLRLLRGVFVGGEEIARDLIDIRTDARRQSGQRPPDVVGAEVGIAFHYDLADLEFPDLETHVAATYLLLRNGDLNGGIAGVGIDLGQGGEGLLDGGESFLRAGERRECSVDARGRQQGIAVHDIASDVETRPFRDGGRLGVTRQRTQCQCERHPCQTCLHSPNTPVSKLLVA